MGELRKRGDVWWIRYYRSGRRYEESSGSAKKGDAVTLLQIREGQGASGMPVTPKHARFRFADAAADLLNDYQTNGKRSAKDVARRIDKHLTPHFAGWRMASISTAEIRAYIRQRQAATEIMTTAHTITRTDGTTRQVPERRRMIEGVSNAEINRELTILKRMFTLAVQSGKLFVRPHIPMLQEHNIRTGFFEPEQFESVRSHLKPHLQNVVAFAYLTGWRTTSEILPLEWRHVDFAAGEVRLDAGSTKNGEARTFPMTIALRRVLEDQHVIAKRLKREKGAIPRYVFTKPNGARIGSFRKTWARACRHAGCPGRLLHDFRRTAIRNLVRAGIPERVAMTMSGHKTRSVFERYNIVSPGDLKEAGAKLDAMGQGQKRDNSPAVGSRRAGA